MILVEIGPRGVGEVRVQATSRAAEDRDLEIWPLVREVLDELDRRLRARMAEVGAA